MTSNTMDNILSNIKSRVGDKVEMAKYVKIAPIERENVSRGWVNFGEANMYPQYLIELQSESPVHGSIVNSISQMIAGQGIVGGNDVANAYLSGLKIDSIVPHISRDLKLFGGYYLEVIWSMDRTTIAQVNHLPFENCRLACSDENDDFIGVWYSRDWSDMRKKKNTPHFIPMFDQETKDALPKQVIFVHTLKMGSEYYPKPDYIGSVNYIELTRQIGEFHVNNILNGFFPSLIASFNNGIPSLEEQHLIKNQLQMSIQGAENAGKVLTFFNEERDRGVEFTAFPINDADKQYQFLSEECTKQIMIAHRVTSPLLFGVRDGGGLGSNTDEMRTALFIFQRQVIEPFQRLIEDGISIICEASNVVATPTIISNEILEVQPVEAQQSALKKKVELESYAPTDEMAGEAELGLKWRDEYGRGGTEVGVARARDISNKRNLSFDTVQRMNSYFSRHEVDKEATGWNQGEEGFPTAGRIAWQLWGGDAGRDWAKRIVERVNVEQSAHELDAIAEELIQLGEDANEDWILIDEYDVDYDEDDAENEAISHIFDAVEVHQVSTGTARPNATSEQDATIDERKYYTRYRYSGRITDVTRPFCTKMLQADKLYRKEDILAMNNRAVNPGWGPNGADTYSCWLYKGGGNCHHIWKKQLYISAKGFGLDLNSPNVRTQAWSKAEKAGYKVRNNYLVEKRPIDMPYNGFLPTNPRFGNK